MQSRDRVALLAAACLCCGLTLWSYAARAKDGAGPVKTPMRLELDRPYIDVTLTGPNGQHVKAHAYIDTGGGAILLSPRLAQRLGSKATGSIERSPGARIVPTTVPALSIGGNPLTLIDAHAFINTDGSAVPGHTDADVALPGRYLRHYVLVFDYPLHTFTIADPASYKPDGNAVKTIIGRGMPVVQVSVAGKSYSFLLDTGGQYCMVSDAVFDPWSKQHPEWPRVAGAYGPANMLLGASFGKSLRMLRIPTLQWGRFRIQNAGVVSRPIGAYEKMMSETVGIPVIGSIGGNVLHHFKVTVDYPAHTVYLDGPAVVHDATLDMVGIMLEPAGHGGYEVAGTAAGVKGIEVGDRLLKVDGKTVSQAPFSNVVQLLTGSPGEPRTLVLQRNGVRVTVHATVQSIL